MTLILCGPRIIEALIVVIDFHRGIGLPMLRRAVEISLYDRRLNSQEGIRTALSYVVPQLNSMCLSARFFPAPWILGY